MYRGKNFLLPMNRAQLAGNGWQAIVLYLWTKGVRPPRFDYRILGLLDGVGTQEIRFCPTAIKHSRDLACCQGVEEWQWPRWRTCQTNV
jgi:hypothetical protein